MATRWNRRRLTLTFLMIGVIGLLYVQQREPDSFPAWSSIGQGFGQTQPPASPEGAFPPPETPPMPPPNQGDAPPPPPAGDGQGQPPPPPPAPEGSVPPTPLDASPAAPPAPVDDGKFHWSQVPLHHPIAPESMRAVPTSSTSDLRLLPKIQHNFGKETEAAKKTRLRRLELVQSNFTHAWNGYKEHAWMSDEVRPIKGTPVVKFGGWAATLVDSLDSLWIMGMHSEFDNAVEAIERIDFTTTSLDEVNVFETNIRYLGGFLAAYDLTDGQYPSLLAKAIELGDMLYHAFDTPNHMPITRWKFEHAKQGQEQLPSKSALVSEVGSLSLEFTRLSQVSGNPKYYDAISRVMDVFYQQQDNTLIPGLWPVVINAEKADFTGASGFTIGGMADSLYEYLPKQHFLLGAANGQYRDMYLKAIAAMERNIFFHPNTKSEKPILFPGDATSNSRENLPVQHIEPRVQHLSCFAGGMVALGARMFGRTNDMETATQLVEGCLWAYENGPIGIMPEVMFVSECQPANEQCTWSEKEWHADVTIKQKDGKADEAFDVEATIASARLTPGVIKYEDTRYILRPEAIESIFILYRMTGDTTLLDRAWNMFESIVSATQTEIAHTALDDCTQPDPRQSQADSMESFWLAETLKYFYLLYSTPDVISLDNYVLNTEAHPFLRPKPK